LFTSVSKNTKNNVDRSKLTNVYLCQHRIFMNINNVYRNCFESRLSGRYISLKHLDPILQEFQKTHISEVLGTSEKGNPIHVIRIGKGLKKVLAWSQMHGNESTTTKSLIDFIQFLLQKKYCQEEIAHFLSEYTLVAIPLLNPDGAELYTRENLNRIDLNRDAKKLAQKESRLLRSLFLQEKPTLCLNLHDQRTIYSVGENDDPATLSFLAPAANLEKDVTSSRESAMLEIARLNSYLQTIIPNQIGRYDDSYNENCVGDSFQSSGVATLLFEAGHSPGDYQREKTRALIFQAFLVLFRLIPLPEVQHTLEDYFAIPENQKNCRDIILRNTYVSGQKQDISIQYKEMLTSGTIDFVPYVDEIGNLSNLKGHKEIDLKGEQILINSHENVFANEKIATILIKHSKKIINI
jgi:Zinc carboxypeptidase